MNTFSLRIRLVLRSVDTGKMVFLVNPNQEDRVQNDLRSVSVIEKEKVLLSIVPEADGTQWIRDGAMGWERNSEGSFSAIGRSVQGKDGTTLRILDSLARCSGEKGRLRPFEVPSFSYEIADGGDFVADHTGLCVGRMRHDSQVAKRLGCSIVIPKPRPSFRIDFLHVNHHVDLAVAFLAPKVAVVSDVEPSCKSDLSSKVREYFNEYAHALSAAAKVIRFPLAGCPFEKEAFGARSSRVTTVLRTYANLLQTNRAFLVPKYRSIESEKVERERRRGGVRFTLLNLISVMRSRKSSTD